jgi:hypothetical protein
MLSDVYQSRSAFLTADLNTTTTATTTTTTTTTNNNNIGHCTHTSESTNVKIQ